MQSIAREKVSRLGERPERSAKHFRELVELAPIGIFQATQDGRFIAANTAFARMLGFASAKELNGLALARDICVDPPVRLEDLDALKRGRESALELRFKKRDGTPVWVEADARIVKDPAGKVLRYEVFALDVTARKRLEEQARMSDERYRLLFESNPQPIWVFDEETLAFLAVNEAACRRYGYTRDEFLSMRASDVRPPEAVPARVGALADSSSRRHRLKSGALIDVETASHALVFGGRPARLVLSTDVTERRRAEAALRESEERYRLLFESNPQPMWVFDEDTHAFLAVNPAACRHYGYSRGEFLAMRISDIVLPENASAPPLPVGRRHRLKDGTRIEVEIAAHAFQFGGRPAQLMLATDVTDRARAVEALSTSEARTRAVLESALDAIITIDEEGRVIDVNAATERTFGWPAAEMMGRELVELIIPPALRAAYLSELDRQRLAGETRIPGKVLELSAMGRGGREFPVEIFISRFEVEGARHFVGYVHDLTRRRKAERDMRRSEERFRRLFESNTIGIAVAEIAGLTLEANDAYLDMLGYTREDLRSGLLGWDQITPSEYRAVDQAAFDELRRTGIASPWEKEMLRKNGTRVPVLLGVAMLEESDASCIAYIVDLSASRQLEKQLRQSQKMEAVGQLAGGVAHDFNNLLTTILGYTQLAASRMDEGSSGLDDLEEVRKAGERAAGLTRQLLAFSRLQVLEPRILDLNVIVGNLEKMLRRLIGENVDIVTALSPSLGRVRADAGEIEQIIINLAVNARDAMPHGGRLTIETANVEADPELPQQRPGRHVLLCVSDNGTGMDAETQSHIFEPFFTTKAKDKGTGLGLSTVYGIVKQSGGHIAVDSEIGRGTTLRISLPEVEGEEAAQTILPAEDASPQGGTETVLLVEDEAPIRILARKILEGLGYSVLEISRGDGALCVARDHPGPIHLLLTDVVMPEMGGVDLAARVLALRPDARILYMSGYTDGAVIRHGGRAQGMHFLQKPFTPASMGRKVREALS